MSTVLLVNGSLHQNGDTFAPIEIVGEELGKEGYRLCAF